MTVKELEEYIKKLPEKAKKLDIEIVDEEDHYYMLKELKIDEDCNDDKKFMIVFYF
jgi:hypothetical protein